MGTASSQAEMGFKSLLLLFKLSVTKNYSQYKFSEEHFACTEKVLLNFASSSSSIPPYIHILQFKRAQQHNSAQHNLICSFPADGSALKLSCYVNHVT